MENKALVWVKHHLNETMLRENNKKKILICYVFDITN